jgi:hypothetical protein
MGTGPAAGVGTAPATTFVVRRREWRRARTRWWPIVGRIEFGHANRRPHGFPFVGDGRATVVGFTTDAYTKSRQVKTPRSDFVFTNCVHLVQT